jgi:hypothetical protein
MRLPLFIVKTGRCKSWFVAQALGFLGLSHWAETIVEPFAGRGSFRKTRSGSPPRLGNAPRAVTRSEKCLACKRQAGEAPEIARSY